MPWPTVTVGFAVNFGGVVSLFSGAVVVVVVVVELFVVTPGDGVVVGGVVVGGFGGVELTGFDIVTEPLLTPLRDKAVPP